MHFEESDFPELIKLRESAEGIFLNAASPEVVKELQQCLSVLKLYEGDIDGITSTKTAYALSKFKEERFLSYPAAIGSSTAASLIEAAVAGHELSEQNPSAALTVSQGAKMRLPNGVFVYEEQRIIDPIPLTWGEYSKGCTRIPESSEVIAAALRVTKLFGEIRHKFGSPIGVTSGYRPASVNRSIGGARHSRHIVGDALDIYPFNGDMSKLLEIVRDSSCTGLGLGMRRGFLHIDCRPGVRVTFNY